MFNDPVLQVVNQLRKQNDLFETTRPKRMRPETSRPTSWDRDRDQKNWSRDQASLETL